MAMIAPDVAPQPSQGPRAQPTAGLEAFGGGPGLEGVNQQIQKVSAEAGDIATFERIRADQTAVQDATAKLSQAHTQILYDPQTGVMTSRGTNALQAQTDGWQKYQKTANDISSTLHGEAQIGAFRKTALAMGDAFNQQTMVHVDQQLQAHDEQSFKALRDNLIDQGAMSYGNPHARQLALNTLDDNMTQYARRNGMDAGQLQDLKSKTNSEFHAQTIARMLGDKHDMMAKQYYGEVKDDITDATTRTAVEKQIEEGSYRGESMRASDGIWQEADGNLQKAYALADKTEDPELRDRIHQRLRAKDGEVKEARTSDQDNAFYDASQLVNRASQNGEVKGVQSLNDVVPPDVWTRMNPAQQAAIKRMVLGGDENSGQIWTNWSLMSPTEKAAMSKAQFQTDVLSHLDNKHRDQAMHQYGEALGNKTTALSDSEQAALIYKSTQQAGIINGVRPGVPASKLKGDAAASNAAFMTDTQALIANFERNELGGRRRASQEEVQKIVDQKVLTALGNKSPSLFTNLGRAVGFSPTPTVTYDRIPDVAKEQLLGIAQHEGKAVTKEQIEVAYAAYLKKDSKGIKQAFQ